MLQVVQGQSVSKSSDVYSYGILMWEIITQKIPFSVVKTFELYFRIANGEVGNSRVYLVFRVLLSMNL